MLIAYAIGMRRALIDRARRYLRNRWDAEDAVQNMFLELVRQSADSRVVENPGAYLLRSVDLVATHRCSRRDPFGHANAVSLDDAEAEGLIPCTMLDDQGLEVARVLRIAQQALTPRQQEVLSLAAQGFECPEIGGKLGISPLTVETTITRGRRKLRAAAERSELNVSAGADPK